MATHPDIDARSRAPSGTPREDVTPAWAVTICSTDTPSDETTTVWSPGERFGIVAGDAPCVTRSTVTSAPAGSVRTSKPPVLFGVVLANSRYCETCAPAFTDTVIVLGSPAPCNTIVCVPSCTVRVAGVKPEALPSTSTGTPLGFDCTVNV